MSQNMSCLSRFNADGTVRIYTHLNGMPIDEYRRMKSKQYYRPHPRQHKRTPEQIEHACQLWSQGLSLKQIAQELQVTVWQVRQAIQNKRDFTVSTRKHTNLQQAKLINEPACVELLET